jgi:hypothetical protein
MSPLLILFTIACSGSDKNQDTAEEIQSSWQPSFHCPGDPSCLTADGALYAGAAKVSITPECFESWRDCGEDGLCPNDEGYTAADSGENDGEYDWSVEFFLDCGCDRLCEGDAGYVASDEGEGDGDFQAIWLGGFHNGRPAIGVHDDIWARAIVLDQGETRLAFVVVDLVGWFYDDVVLTREMLSEQGVEIDYLLVSATHNHESPDTMGLWGKTATSGGYDEAYGLQVRQATVDAVSAAVADLREVDSLKVGQVDASSYADNGLSNIIRDSRDPKVIDEMLRAALLRDTSGQTIATLSYFGNHPEAMADENVMLTSDFPGPMRDFLESGVQYENIDYQRDGYGGVSIFINGAVGGLMTPLGITIVDREGVARREYTFERLDAFGKVMAEMAMDAIDEADEYTDLSISVTSSVFELPIDNYGFQGMFLSGILDRETYSWDSSELATEDNKPHVRTEIAHIKLGPISFMTVPGEIFPELLIGGYDGSHVGDPNNSIIDEDNSNPPDLSQAPQGPYIQDMLSSEHPWIVGLGNDELGYIVPEYDFLLDDRLPWFNEPDGDHYEETNSLGMQTHGIVRGNIEKILNWESQQ